MGSLSNLTKNVLVVKDQDLKPGLSSPVLTTPPPRLLSLGKDFKFSVARL